MTEQKKHSSISLFNFLFDLFAGIFTIVWTLLVPPDPKNSIFLGYSAKRLMLFGFQVLVVFAIILLFLNRYSIKKYLVGDQVKKGLISSLLVTLLFPGILCSFILLFPSSTIAALSDAAFFRLQPIFFLIAVLCLHWALIILFNIHDWFINYINDLLSKLDQSPKTGWILLLVSLLFSLANVYFTYYNVGDEGDTVAVGWLISQGQVLYKDIFSHHFPLAYYFTSFIFSLFPQTIFSVRFGWILLRTILFGITMKITHRYLSTGLIMAIWSIAGVFYLGNMLLYQSINAILLANIFLLTFSYIVHNSPKADTKENGSFEDRLLLIYLGLLLGFTVINDPLNAYQDVIVCISVVIITFFKTYKKTSFKNFIIPIITLGATSLIPIILTLMVMSLSGSFSNFISYGINFNLNIYNKYTAVVTPATLFQNFKSGLGISNPILSGNLSPLYTWDSFGQLDSWLFTGFLFRLTIIITCILLAIKSNFFLSLMIYLLSVAASARSGFNFHASAFVLYSITISILLITNQFSNVPSLIIFNDKYSSFIYKFTYNTIRMLLFITLGWLTIRFLGYEINHHEDLTYQSNFQNYEETADYLKKITCNSKQVKLMVYPLDPYIYFFSRIKPASKFIFMLPWTAEIGQDEIINDAKSQPTIVKINLHAVMWNYPISQYLSKFIKYLKGNYINYGPDLSISPAVTELCPAR